MIYGLLKIAFLCLSQNPDPDYAEQLPYFGPIMDNRVVEPEEELELEELKHEQPYVYDKRRSGRVMNTVKPPVTSQQQKQQATTAATTTPAPAQPASTPKSGTTASITSKKVVPPPAPAPGVMKHFGGQKEIAMLRPPASPKSHHFQPDEPEEEPTISLAQRSPSNEKPSAYDRLRKYLSLDDALKKVNRKEIELRN